MTDREQRSAVTPPIVIDGLQYCNWSSDIFTDMRIGGVTAVHATIAYWENFRETVSNIITWKRRLRTFHDRILLARTGDDVRAAHAQGKTAVIMGAQNSSVIEGDIGLVEIIHELGVRLMQLTYNNQSLLATGCYEKEDAGLTRMGREVVREMNRIGLVVDMSHGGERSTLDAIEYSGRPVAITHGNPAAWHPVRRNQSDAVLKALSDRKGMLGVSLYPHHLQGGSDCSLTDFCDMVARTVDRMGIACVGIGSDLCQNQPDAVVEWMRNGRWTNNKDYGEGSADNAGFPQQPAWFSSNRDFRNIAGGLKQVGFSAVEVDRILGLNWLDFFDRSFGPRGSSK